MSVDLVPDDLWDEVGPLLPPRSALRYRFPGRKRVEDRPALGGISFVLRTNVAWRDVPTEKIGCSGVTCWRRLKAWTEAGVWPRLHEVLLAELRAATVLEMNDVAVDGSHVRALKGDHTGPSRVDRARPGSKHLIVDRHGTPLAVSLTGGNRHDVTQLMPLVEAIPPIRDQRGRPRNRPRRLFADRGYDYDRYRKHLRGKGTIPMIARGVAHGSGLGKTRWVVAHLRLAASIQTPANTFRGTSGHTSRAV